MGHCEVVSAGMGILGVLTRTVTVPVEVRAGRPEGRRFTCLAWSSVQTCDAGSLMVVLLGQVIRMESDNTAIVSYICGTVGLLPRAIAP